MIIAGKSHRYKKGHIPYSKIHPESVKKGKSHYAWKDIKVGYRALHLWLRRVKGKPTKCRHCGIVSNQPRKIDWANIDHKYSRNPEDYIPLCKSCHKIYDIKMASATRGS